VKPFGGRGSALDPAGGAKELTAHPDSIAGGEGTGCTLSKNPTPALDPPGLAQTSALRAEIFFASIERNPGYGPVRPQL